MTHIHKVQSVDIDVEAQAVMIFRDFTYAIGVYQDANGIYLSLQAGDQQSWYRCENDGSAFLLWGELNDNLKETQRINERAPKDQVYIETFREGSACVLCLPVHAGAYLEYDLVDTTGELQRTRIEYNQSPLEDQQHVKSRRWKKLKLSSQRYFLIRADYNTNQTMQTSCFFMSDGTFRYKPGDIRPMLD